MKTSLLEKNYSFDRDIAKSRALQKQSISVNKKKEISYKIKQELKR